MWWRKVFFLNKTKNINIIINSNKIVVHFTTHVDVVYYVALAECAKWEKSHMDKTKITTIQEWFKRKQIEKSILQQEIIG